MPIPIVGRNSWAKGNIFFNFSPIQKKAWDLVPGETYVLRYRMCVYTGEPSAEMGEAQWQRYAQQPTTQVESLD